MGCPTKAGEHPVVNTTYLYHPYTERIFCGGAANKGKNMSGTMMRTALRSRNPRWYDILLEQHVNGMIQAMFTRVV